MCVLRRGVTLPPRPSHSHRWAAPSPLCTPLAVAPQDTAMVDDEDTIIRRHDEVIRDLKERFERIMEERKKRKQELAAQKPPPPKKRRR